MFHRGCIGHDGFRQIRQIALAEERQRKFSHALAQADALFTALAVGLAVGIVVLEPVRHPEHDREKDEPHRIRNHVGQRRSFRQGCDELFHQVEEEPYAEHGDKVHDHGPEGSETDVLRTLRGERVLLSHSHYRAPPSDADGSHTTTASSSIEESDLIRQRAARWYSSHIRA